MHVDIASCRTSRTWVKYDRIDVAGTVQDAQDNQLAVFDAEISAIVADHVEPQTRSNPLAGGPGHAKISDTGKIVDDMPHETGGGFGVVGGNVIVDRVQVVASRIGDDELAAFDGTGSPDEESRIPCKAIPGEGSALALSSLKPSSPGSCLGR